MEISCILELMKLKTYLRKNRISQRTFASEIEISASLLCKIINGSGKNARGIRPYLAERIEKATNGKVDRLELLYPNSRW